MAQSNSPDVVVISIVDSIDDIEAAIGEGAVGAAAAVGPAVKALVKALSPQVMSGH